MSLNCKEIDIVLGELKAEGCFIQDIVQSSYDTIAFYLYGAEGAKTMFVCLAPGACRVHETRCRVPKNDKPLRFMEFLRSRVRGVRVQECRQLRDDRIVYLRLSKSDEELNMYIRLWSGAANIIVTDTSDNIQDVFFRRPKRGEVTGGVYVSPEPRPAPDKVWVVRTFSGEDEVSVPGTPDVQGVPGDAGTSDSQDTPRAFPSTYSERVDRWYAEHAASLSREALLELAEKQYLARRSRMEAALEKLEAKREDFLHADRWKHQGDLVLANAWKIAKGADSVECEDYESGSTVRIPLDSRVPPQENARVFYETWKKAVSGLEQLEDDIGASRRALDTLRDDYERLRAEENPLVIHKLLRRQNTPKQQIEKKYPGLAFSADDWLFLVGRSAAENDELLRHFVKGKDMWFHVRDWSGGYVFVKNRPGKTIPLDIMLDAGNLALFYSKGRKAGKGDLYCTEVRYLRRAKNAPRGTVLPYREKNLYVELDEERLKRLETGRIE